MLVVGADHDNVAVPEVAATVTVVLCTAVPPVPRQLKVNVFDELMAPVVCVPLVAFVPLQPLEAVQEVTLVDDHFKVEAPPLLTVLGLAERVTAGAARVTETVADCVALPPVPVQVIP